jgi:hypothetical protein
MDKILIEDLLENKWLCPFDKNALDILISNEVSTKYIQQFFDLCVNVRYQFSSPGNSFERKLINIINRKYQLDSRIGPCSIRRECELNDEWLSSYENLINLIRNEASKIKFRKFKETNMNFIKVADNEITNTFRSEVLNNEGIIATYNTFYK